MLSVQVPGGTACVAEYGAPPEMGLAPSHVSDQDTSPEYDPLLTVTAEVTGGAGGGDGEEGESETQMCNCA